jgi:hypothetical protein
LQQNPRSFLTSALQQLEGSLSNASDYDETMSMLKTIIAILATSGSRYLQIMKEDLQDFTE